MKRAILFLAIILAIALIAVAIAWLARSPAVADRGIAHQPGEDFDRFAFAQAHRDMRLEPMYRRGL